MSDSQKPSFLGGLPSRDTRNTPTSEATGVAVGDVGGGYEPVAPPAAPPVPPVYSPGQSGDQGNRVVDDKLNTLALVSFIGSFFISLLGIIAGHIALGQIKKTGQRGRGFALAGTIIGYASFLIGTVSLIVMIVATMAVGGAINAGNEAIKDLSGSSDGIIAEAVEGADSAVVEGVAASAELCTALNGFATLSAENLDAMGQALATNAAAPEELVSVLNAIAAVESPNQGIYQGFAQLLTDPASISSIADAMTVSSDFTKAAQSDLVTCM